MLLQGGQLTVVTLKSFLLDLTSSLDQQMNHEYEFANRDVILFTTLSLKECQQRIVSLYLACFLMQQCGDVVQPCC